MRRARGSSPDELSKARPTGRTIRRSSVRGQRGAKKRSASECNTRTEEPKRSGATETEHVNGIATGTGKGGERRRTVREPGEPLHGERTRMRH